MYAQLYPESQPPARLWLSETDFERSELRLLAKFLGRDLVHRDAALNARAFGLLGMDAGQQHGAAARMVARTVAERPAVDLRQSAQHQ